MIEYCKVGEALHYNLSSCLMRLLSNFWRQTLCNAKLQNESATIEVLYLSRELWNRLTKSKNAEQALAESHTEYVEQAPCFTEWSEVEYSIQPFPRQRCHTRRHQANQRLIRAIIFAGRDFESFSQRNRWITRTQTPWGTCCCFESLEHKTWWEFWKFQHEMKGAENIFNDQQLFLECTGLLHVLTC